MDEPIQLSPAYRWLCPDCGWLNYTEPTPVEFTVSELAAVRDRLSDEAHHAVVVPRGRTIVVPPDLVTCAVCQMEFTATDGTDVEEPDATSY